MPKVKVKEINIYYETQGEGFPFVMIRGLSSDVYRWPPECIETLSKKFKLVLFDNRGAGRTDKPDIEYSINMMAEDTVGLMNALNIEKAHILGFSMGGLIAQEIAISYPEKVEKLILSATGCGGNKGVSASDEVLSLLRSDREGLTPEEALRNSLPLLFTEDFIRDQPDKIEEFAKRSLMAPIPPYSYRRQLDAIGRYSSYDRLGEIKSPTLIIHGEKDILVPPQNAEILAKNIEGAKIAYLPNLGHDKFSQGPMLVAETILKFLV
jgi:pimeloyl-ACP methyl ester carboxylesterase